MGERRDEASVIPCDHVVADGGQREAEPERSTLYRGDHRRPAAGDHTGKVIHNVKSLPCHVGILGHRADVTAGAEHPARAIKNQRTTVVVGVSGP